MEYIYIGEKCFSDEKKSQQHPKDFPGGHPPQYYPGLALLNFGVRKGSGVFNAVWPLTNIWGDVKVISKSIYTPKKNQANKKKHQVPKNINSSLVMHNVLLTEVKIKNPPFTAP